LGTGSGATASSVIVTVGAGCASVFDVHPTSATAEIAAATIIFFILILFYK
jgi:hypothetical protein